nr:FAD-dependent oxidoreductase [Clostridia bacterium]
MKRIITTLLAIALVAAIVVASVFGVQKNGLTKELEAIKAELAASKTNADALTAEVKKLTDKAAELETKVADLTAKGEAYAADAETAKAALEAAKTELEAAKAELEAALTPAADADIIIVGAGGAGLSAAIHAAEAGAEKVIVLEMTAKTGGALNFTSGSMSAAGTIIQKEEGIEDSIESYVADIINNGDDFNGQPNEELIRVYANDATEVFDWLYENGIKDMFRPGAARAVFAPEHALYSVPRTYKPSATDKSYKSAAHQVLDKLVAADERIEIITLTTAKELVANEKGQITGVKAEGPNGEVTYTSKNGVIVCTGGYSSNGKLMGQYAAEGDKYLQGGAPGADGYGIYMMQKVGAGVTAMDSIPTFPMGMISRTDETKGQIASTYTWKAGAISVNKNGERFCNETTEVVSDREVALEYQPDAVLFDIYTDKILADLNAAGGAVFMNYYFYEGGAGDHVMYKADSIEGLAEAIGVPAENLKKTIETYNAAVEAGVDAEFGRKLDGTDNNYNLAINKIEGDMYYAIRLHALCVMTLGGVTANANMQVLDEAGNVIPGLYAAGECVGGIWGKFVSGGTGVMGPIVFGRIAAKHAMVNEMATGYEVKEAAGILDASLFEKETAVEEKFDMTKTLNDGEYEATVDGQSGPMTVKVVIADGKIADVQVVSHNETAGICDAPIASVPAKIVAGNTATVDTVAGATLTSNRIMNAVALCLEKAAQ